MDEQIEQIARAMALNDWPGNEWNIECFSEREQDEYRKHARAAHSVMSGTVAELEEALSDAVVLLLTLGVETGPGTVIDEANVILRKLDNAALAPPRRHD